MRPMLSQLIEPAGRSADSPIIIRVLLGAVLLLWCASGIWTMLNWHRLYLRGQKHIHENPGAISLTAAQAAAVWLGFFAVALYFLLL
jgi:hypothetical protein